MITRVTIAFEIANLILPTNSKGDRLFIVIASY